MSHETNISRRSLLRAGLGGACSLAAHPLITPMAFAAAPTDQRLVVIVLRGGMDGMSVIEPYGDRNLKRLRPRLSSKQGEGLSDLDGFFGLHANLKPLMPLWQAGELAFAPAVSTPYRDKRSHFDGQDALETGSGTHNGISSDARDGWLNRLLSHMPGSTRETAMVLAPSNMLIMEGPNPTITWSPKTRLRFDGANRDLLEAMYTGDPLFHNALEGAVLLANDSAKATDKKRHQNVAQFAAHRLAGESRIVTFSVSGWDTHGKQAQRINGPMNQLRDAILTLKSELGPVWAKTTVIALTEFGRTARENGSLGTDHGTAGALLMAGGSIKGGQIYGEWPGLGPGDLYQDRDLMPTTDCRRYCAWLLRSKFGIGRTAIERDIFPGLDMEDDLRLLG